MIYFILATLVFTYLAYRRLDWAVLGIIATTPLYLWRANLGGLPLTFLEVMILVTFLMWLLKGGLEIKTLFKKTPSRTPYPFRWEIIAILVTSWSGVIIAGTGSASLGIWKAYFFEPILLFILIINLFSHSEGRKKIVGALSLSALVVSLFALFQWLTGLYISNPFWAEAATRRATSFFPYPNAVGLFLAPLVPIIGSYLINYWKNLKTKKRIFHLGTLFVSCLAILAAKSEGAIVGLAAGLGLMSLLLNKKTRLVTVGLSLIILAGLWLTPPLKEYTLSKATLSDLSGQIRKQQWKETWQMLNNNRLISGAGLSAYQEAVTPFHQDGIWFKTKDPNWLRNIMHSEEYRQKMWQPTEIYLYPHNIVLNFWTEIGLLGMLAFMWLLGRAIWQSLHTYRQGGSEKFLALGLATSLIVISVHGLVDVPYFKNDLAALFWVSLALIGGLSLKLNESKNITKNNC